MHLLVRRFIAVVVPAATVLLVAAAAAAMLAPTPSERAAIIRAFGDPPSAGPCLVVRLAQSDRSYGEVQPRLTANCARWAFNGVNVLKRERAGRWKVLFKGSSYHCPVPHIPRAVQKDLGVCPTS